MVIFQYDLAHADHSKQTNKIVTCNSLKINNTAGATAIPSLYLVIHFSGLPFIYENTQVNIFVAMAEEENVHRFSFHKNVMNSQVISININLSLIKYV